VADQNFSLFIAGASALDCQLLGASLGRNVQIVGAACKSDDVISGVKRQNPRAALISCRLQDGELAGLAALQEVSALTPGLRSIMLLDSGESDIVVESFRAGAVGVFSRNNGALQLRECVHAVLQGRPWVSDADVFSLIRAVRSGSSADRVSTKSTGTRRAVSLLTPREEEIVHLLLSGMTNRGMAIQLGLSQHTIKNYFFSIFEKTGVSNRVELLLYAMNRRKIPPSVTGRPEDRVIFIPRPHADSGKILPGRSAAVAKINRQ
jgi:two-component system, NarL family, nitrate/nitrite response regulator NarL